MECAVVSRTRFKVRKDYYNLSELQDNREQISEWKPRSCSVLPDRTVSAYSPHCWLTARWFHSQCLRRPGVFSKAM